VVEEPVQVAFVDQGYTAEQAAADAAKAGIRLEVIKHHQAKHGFVLLPRRWVVERSFAWAARFRRLARDYERLASTLAYYHWLAFTTLMLATLFPKRKVQALVLVKAIKRARFWRVGIDVIK
jgi:transposase